MKRIIIVLAIFTAYIIQMQAQVTIGSGDPPNPNAILDLKQQSDGSSLKGFLLPRVALTGIYSPSPMSVFEAGMVVYNTASVGLSTDPDAIFPGFYYSNGARWIRLVPATEIIIPSEAWKDVMTGEGATLNTQNIYQNAQVTIGKAGAPDSSAQLDVSSGDKGMLIPRLTLIQRNSISNPVQSLLIWNIDEGCFNFWKNGKWRSMCGDLGEAVISVTDVDCENAIIAGTYKVGTPANGSNYIELILNVIEPGSYIIEGQTGKGFFFQRIGTFSTTGIFPVQIPAIGMPNEAGTWSFPLTLNGEPFSPDCLQEVKVDSADVKFNFDTSYCGTKAYSEQLIKGEASTGKTTKIRVNVETAGVFNFSSNTVHGVQYTANNISLASGLQEVTLTANGNPPVSAETNATFTITGTGLNGAACQVLVDIIENNATLTVECSSATVNGTYRLATAMTSANYIDIPVTFNSTGSWSATATNSEAGFSFSGNGTASSTGIQSIRLYASGTPLSAGTKVFAVSINTATCSIPVSIIMPTKNILYLGNNSAYVVAALKNTANFGPNGKSPVESVSVLDGGNPYANATTLINLINNNNIEIILAGWTFDCTDAVANVIADFVRNKKGFFFQVEGQVQQTYLKLILDKAYGTSVSFTDDIMPIYSTILPNINNPKLNGAFGDIRGKYVRSDDNTSWIGLTPGTQTGPLGSLVQLGANGAYVARNTFVYAPGFFMAPDWGMYNYVGTSYGTASPIGPNTSSLNGLNSWDGSSYGITDIGVGKIVNWVLFGNAMDEAFRYVQDNIVKTYQVDTDFNQ